MKLSRFVRRPAMAWGSRPRIAHGIVFGVGSLLLACFVVACGGSDEAAAPPPLVPSAPVRTSLYVSPDGSDLNAGTRVAPFKSIQRAIDGAVGLTDIQVAEGGYNESVRLRPDASIYGGYKSTDWNVRDPKLYVSRVGAGSLGLVTITCPSGVTSTTVVSGLTIVGTTFISNSTALSVSPGASPVISGNTVMSGAGMGAVGLSLAGSAAIVVNNIISVSLTNSMGIHVSGTSSDKILNNTINVAALGIAGVAYGINISSTAASGLEVSNNIIVVSGGVQRYGIVTNAPSGVEVRNNDIVVFDDSGGAFVGSAGNIAVDPRLDDFRLVATSPAAVKFGGISLAGFVGYPRNFDGAPIDIDSQIRTEPWSIGVNEVDD